MQRDDLQFFDPKSEWDVVERALPHWSQPGVVTFITWRSADSLPESVLSQLDRETEALIRREGFEPQNDWQRHLLDLTPQQRAKVRWNIFAIRDKYLHQLQGACLLASPEVSKLVFDSLLHFDQDRYFLTDVVIMPNHLHLLCAFAGNTEMLKQCSEWKRYTARQINRQLRREGAFWQVEQFDHLVRSSHQFQRFRRYIAENPAQANLQPGEYRYFQKNL
jgi:hypothetical protein